jgi:LPXTG-site transpeptidase (sortase) family protein
MTEVIDLTHEDEQAEIAVEAVPAADPEPDVSDAPTRVSTVGVVIRRGLLVVGLFLAGFGVFVVLLSSLLHARAQTGLDRSFAKELENATAPVNGPIDEGAAVAVLEIPAVGVHEVVVEGTTATELTAGPGHLRTSAVPGQPGVSVLFGRRVSYGGPFRHLDRLREGDLIMVTTGQGTMRYEVTSSRTGAASDASVFRARASNALVLVTSDPPLLASERLAVRARPIDEPFAAGTRVSGAPLAVDELGLEGDRNAAILLLVWLEVLVVLAFATVLLFSRWKRWPAWTIAVPILAAALWLVYEQASRLLPATL